MLHYTSLLILAVCAGAAPAADIQELINTALTQGRAECVLPAGTHTLDAAVELAGVHDFTVRGAGNCRILVRETDSAVIKASNCQRLTLSDLHLQHIEPLEGDICLGPVVLLLACTETRIQRCFLDGCGAFGVDARDSHTLTITRCDISNNSTNALLLVNCEEIVVTHNLIIDNHSTLQAIRVTDLRMSDNVIHSNGGEERANHEEIGRPAVTDD